MSEQKEDIFWKTIPRCGPEWSGETLLYICIAKGLGSREREGVSDFLGCFLGYISLMAVVKQ